MNVDDVIKQIQNELGSGVVKKTFGYSREVSMVQNLSKIIDLLAMYQAAQLKLQSETSKKLDAILRELQKR